MLKRKLVYAQAINEAFEQIMKKRPEVYLIGLGIPDPKGVFGTTQGLQEKFGKRRVMDMPVSENALTGVVIGSAIAGMRPVITHQRADFVFLALDQLINNAAKWDYMFGGKKKVPLVVRLIMGRGWGQGPQHAQSVHSSLSHFPGLKIVMPANAYDAKGLLVSSIKDDSPVIFIEHRWLHSITGPVPDNLYDVPIGKAQVIRKGRDLSIVSCSHMTLEAWKAACKMEKWGVNAEVIDLRTIAPLDCETVFASVKKTGRLLVLDPDWKQCGLAGEIISCVVEKKDVFKTLKAAPQRISYPPVQTPTSWALSNFYYPIVEDIIAKSLLLLGKMQEAFVFEQKSIKKKQRTLLDKPDVAFTGPF